MKPAGRGISDRLRGLGLRCIHDPRSMHLAVCVGRERCIKSGGVSSRSPRSVAVDGGGIRVETGQSVEIDGIATPVHTEAYE